MTSTSTQLPTLHVRLLTGKSIDLSIPVSATALELEDLVSSHERTARGKWRMMLMPERAPQRRLTPAELREAVEDDLPTATDEEKERELNRRIRESLGGKTAVPLADPDASLASLGLKEGEERTLEIVLDMGGCHTDRSLKTLKEGGVVEELDSCTAPGGSKCKACGGEEASW